MTRRAAIRALLRARLRGAQAIRLHEGEGELAWEGWFPGHPCFETSAGVSDPRREMIPALLRGVGLSVYAFYGVDNDGEPIVEET